VLARVLMMPPQVPWLWVPSLEEPLLEVPLLQVPRLSMLPPQVLRVLLRALLRMLLRALLRVLLRMLLREAWLSVSLGCSLARLIQRVHCSSLHRQLESLLPRRRAAYPRREGCSESHFLSAWMPAAAHSQPRLDDGL
jgi:hypothetical protein